MTAQDYVDAGYELSKNIEQKIIDKAEADVIQAYVVPILGSDETEEIEAEVMALAYCLMLRRTANKTRYGTEQKSNPYGIQANNANLMMEIQGHAFPAIKSLREKEGAIEFPNVVDIIGFGYYIF